MELVFVVGSCLAALGSWTVYARRHQQNRAQRADLVAGMLLIGGFALFFISLGMLQVSLSVEPDSASVHLVDLAVQVLGAGLILVGIFFPWWMLTGNHGYVEKYRGAPELPTLRRVMATVGVAMGVFLAGLGVMFVTLFPLTTSAALIVVGAVSGAGALVMMGAAFAGAIVMHKAEVWRQRQPGG